MRPRLSNPPIIEATLEVQIGQRVSVTEEAMVQGISGFLDGYSNRQVERAYFAEFKSGLDAPPSVRAEDRGYAGTRAATSNGVRQVYFGVTRFAFTHFKPYPGWTVFKNEVLRLWRPYLETVKPFGVARLGLRTINRIPLAGSQAGPPEWNQVLRAVPEALQVSQTRTGLMTVETYRAGGSAVEARLVRATEDGPEGPIAIIDVDVWQPIVLAAAVDIGDAIEQLRETKNDLFFASLAEGLDKKL